MASTIITHYLLALNTIKEDLSTWTVVDGLHDSLELRMPTSPTIYGDPDEIADGVFSDPDVPNASIALLLVVPITSTRSYTAARLLLFEALEAIRATLNALTPVPDRLYARAVPLTVGSGRAWTAAVAVDYENII